jgi:hypothetical protein
MIYYTHLTTFYFIGYKKVQVGSGSGRIRIKAASWIRTVIQDYGFKDPIRKNIYESTTL